MKFIFTVDLDGNAKQLGATNENYETVEQENYPAKEYHPDTHEVLKYNPENGVHWEYIPFTPAELREKAYETEKCIEYGGELLTVDEANHLWEVYEAEGSERAVELTELIAVAKAEIRERYPDEPIESEDEDDA